MLTVKIIQKCINMLKSRQNFIVYSGLRILTMLLGFASNIFIVRKINLEEFGAYSLAIMVLGLAVNLGFSWHASSVIYFGTKELSLRKNKLNQTFWARNIILIGSLFLTSIVFVVFRNSLNNFIGYKLAYMILLWLYIRVLGDYLVNYYLTVSKQVLASIIQITSKVIFLVIIIIFKLNVFILVEAGIFSEAVTLVFLVNVNWKQLFPRRVPIKWFKEILNFSLWQLFGFIGLYVVNFGDNYVIKLYMTNKGIGIYNLAYQLFLGVCALSGIITSFFVPKLGKFISEDNKAGLRKFFYKERTILMLFIFVGHLILFIFSKQILLIIYSQKGMEAVGIFRILMVASLFSFYSAFYFPIYNLMKKYMVLQVINIVQATINILLDFILIRKFQIYGPAIATTVAVFISCILTALYGEFIIKQFINNSKIGIITSE